MHVERDHNKEIDDLYTKVNELSHQLFRLSLLVTLLFGAILWLFVEVME